MLNKLRTSHNWDKVVDLKISKVRNDTFIKTLLAVDSNDMKNFLTKDEEENKIQDENIIDDQDQTALQHQYIVRQ